MSFTFMKQSEGYKGSYICTGTSLPLTFFSAQNIEWIFYSASIAVYSSIKIVGVIGFVAICIKRAAKLTQSPKIEYSLLDPLVPTTPQNAVPVDTPMAQRHLIFLNYSSKINAVNKALTASF